MKVIFTTVLTLIAMSTAAFANDGGIAAIQVDQIKMREQRADGSELRRIANPHFTITFEGREASNLQKILPSELSVFTAMHPDQAAIYRESFKTLGVTSNASNGVTGKVITISCSDAEMRNERVVKTGKTTCTIQVNVSGSNDDLGDVSPFVAPVCR